MVALAGAELPLSLIEQLVTAITDPVIVEIVRSLEKIQVRGTRHDTTRTDIQLALTLSVDRSSKSKTWRIEGGK